jgi:hypothetical protein
MASSRIRYIGVKPCLTVGLACVALALMETPGWAQVPTQRCPNDEAKRPSARTFATTGREAFERAQHAKNPKQSADLGRSIEELTRSIALYPTPRAACWLASAYELQGNKAAAARAYGQCWTIDLSACPMDDKQRKLQEEAREEAKPRMPRLTVSASSDMAGAMLKVDGKPTTLDTTTLLIPGSHTIELSQAGYVTQSMPIELELDERRRITLSLVPEKLDHPEPVAAKPAVTKVEIRSPPIARPKTSVQPPRPAPSTVLPLTACGLLLASSGATLSFKVTADARYEDWKGARNEDEYQRYGESTASWDRATTMGLMAMGVFGAGCGFTLYRYFDAKGQYPRASVGLGSTSAHATFLF